MRRSIPVLGVALIFILLTGPVVSAQEVTPPAPTPPAPTAAGPAAADAPRTADAPKRGPEATEGTISLMQIVKWGGYIGYFIIFLSVLTVMLIIFHLILLRREKLCPVAVRDKIGSLFSERNMEGAADYVRNENSLLGRVVSGGLSRVRGGYADMEEIINDVAEDEAMRLEQSVGYFSLIAAVAPLCGLLGTVVGMIKAFNTIAIQGVPTPGELAAPIEEALVTTAFGLIVAIPNVVAYTVFRNRLTRLLADMGLVVEELMTPFRVQSAAAASAASEAPPADDEVPAGEGEVNEDDETDGTPIVRE